MSENNTLVSALAPGSVEDVHDNPLMIENSPFPGHLYPILKVKEVYGHKLINLRNPYDT